MARVKRRRIDSASAVPSRRAVALCHRLDYRWVCFTLASLRGLTLEALDCLYFSVF